MKYKKPLMLIGTLGATAVALGAFGAHYLKNQIPTGKITPDQVNGFDTAVKYQFYHTLAIFCIVVFRDHLPSKYLNWSIKAFAIGIFLFSGSLYLLTTRGLLGADSLRFLGPVTPVGGLFFIAGWLLVLFSAFGKKE
jgi:uncharacterized membrane protein YgdD (TMEM256/DUF423 family)